MNEYREIHLSGESILQGEPSIKNAHTASHLRIYNNQFVFVCIDQCIYIYSMVKMGQNKAPLVNIIQLKNIFGACQKEHYEDFVTSIFRNAEKQDFSTQIFTKEGDTKSNVLLKIENVKERIAFFNNVTITVTKFQLNEKGQILILLADGRAIILENERWATSSFNIINLNLITKQKIKQACFLQPNGVCLAVKDKITVIVDLGDKSKAVLHRYNLQSLGELYGLIDKDKIKIYAIFSKEVHCLQFKKKFQNAKVVKLDEYVHQSFFCRTIIYIVNQIGLVTIDLNSLQSNTMKLFDHPIELAYIDSFGNYISKSLSNSKESLWVVDSTSNGVFIGQTVRKNGNYKEGRLLVFEPSMPYFLQRLLKNVHDGNYINMQDTIFISKSKQNKQFCQNFSSSLSSQQIRIHVYGLQISISDYYAVCANLINAFQGKQKQKQRMIERSIQHRFQNMRNQNSLEKYDYAQLKTRCCFTGRKLNQQQLNYCENCDLFGIEQYGSKCVVCLNRMCRYE